MELPLYLRISLKLSPWALAYVSTESAKGVRMKGGVP